MGRWTDIGTATTLGLLLTASPVAAQPLMTIETLPGSPNQRWVPDPSRGDLPKPPTAREYESILAYVRGLTASQIDPELPAIAAHAFDPPQEFPSDDNTAVLLVAGAADPPDAVTPPEISNPAGIRPRER